MPTEPDFVPEDARTDQAQEWPERHGRPRVAVVSFCRCGNHPACTLRSGCSSVSPPSSADTFRSALEGERERLTALFTDLEGSRVERLSS